MGKINPQNNKNAVDSLNQDLAGAIGIDRLPEADIQELQNLLKKSFPDWDPLADDGRINGVVLDDPRTFNGSTHMETVSERILSANRGLVDLERLQFSHKSLEKLSDEIENGRHKRLEFANISMAYKDLWDIKELATEIEKWRSGGTAPAGLSKEALSTENLFEPKQKDLVKAYFKATDPAVYDMIMKVERLAKNTDGPVTIAAGNLRPGAVNTLSFADAPNIVIVGADYKGERASYSAEGMVYTRPSTFWMAAALRGHFHL